MSIIGLKTDILSLREKHPDLTEDFVRLQGELNLQPAGDETPYHCRANRHLPLQVHISLLYQADKAFDQLREEMEQATADGRPIIVVNVSEYRSDAILVERFLSAL
ncbi:hypothetical protein F5B21DRAFT_503916 [Xylaria acuta]|nr:hypothetical protein F5B21DRAFT_503916 [Xylaria acuta]